MDRSFLVVASAAGLLLAAPAYAHHSLALFDREKTVTVTGTVRQFDWTNPHVGIEIVVDDTKGANVVWSVEGGTPSVLVRDGWRPGLLKPGDRISLSIHPRKDGSAGGYYADERPVLINGEPLAGKASTPADNSRCD